MEARIASVPSCINWLPVLKFQWEAAFCDDGRKFRCSSFIGSDGETFFLNREWSLRQDGWYLKPGSVVTGVKMIAMGREIHEVDRLVDMYPLEKGSKTKPSDWQKVRGTAVITDGKRELLREIHWYQCENIGKVEFKVKARGEGT